MNTDKLEHEMLTIRRVIGKSPWYGRKVLTEQGVELTISNNPHVREYAAGRADLTLEDVYALYGITLDYSGASLEQIERLLVQMQVDLKPATDEDMVVFVEDLGSYFGQVILRQHGGHWVETRINDILIPAVQLRQRVWFPLTFAYLRIANGPAHSLSEAYRRLAEVEAGPRVESPELDPFQWPELGLVAERWPGARRSADWRATRSSAGAAKNDGSSG
jgi:hypothetical protein